MAMLLTPEGGNVCVYLLAQSLALGRLREPVLLPRSCPHTRLKPRPSKHTQRNDMTFSDLMSEEE